MTPPDPLSTFIPCTREVSIGDGVVYRPIRSWHSGTFGGERLPQNKNGDRSGCVYPDGSMNPPLTVTSRLYWNVARPEDTISAFLSYPNGMGCLSEYFWEELGCRTDGDISRYRGPNAEANMESVILARLGDSAVGSAEAIEAKKTREDRPRKNAEAKERLRDAAEALLSGKTPEEVFLGETDNTDPFTLN